MAAVQEGMPVSQSPASWLSIAQSRIDTFRGQWYNLKGARNHVLEMPTVSPVRMALKVRASHSRWPNTLTGLAGRISQPVLAGVAPKKMQKASPGGQ
jgi:hypothetical protein